MNSAQFEILFKKLYAPLCRQSFRLVREKSVAEDLVQDVFLKFWNRKESLPENLNIEAYLYQSVRNTCLNYLKTEKKWANQETEDIFQISQNQTTDGRILVNELENALQNGIDEMPEGCRNIFILSRYEDLSYKEIAETLDISIKTVEGQMSKALRILRKHLMDFLVILPLLISTIFHFFSKTP